MRRLRGPYPPDQLREVYSRRYDHTRWADHRRRVRHTITLGQQLLADQPDIRLVADLACGDAAIPLGICQRFQGGELDPRSPILGDLTGGPDRDDVGPIERTIRRLPQVDLLVCTEILEHVDDPAGLLAAARERTRWLLLSTPVTDGRDDNPEHYWSWGAEDIRGLLTAAGFRPQHHELLDLRAVPGSYLFQLWIAR